MILPSLLRNLEIAGKLGCLNDSGLAAMRRGRGPIVQKGPYKGDELSVDHIIPRAVVPELDNVIANLELLPLNLNETKNSKIGERQLALARRFHAAGMLSKVGLHAVETRRSFRGPRAPITLLARSHNSPVSHKPLRELLAQALARAVEFRFNSSPCCVQNACHIFG